MEKTCDLLARAMPKHRPAPILLNRCRLALCKVGRIEDPVWASLSKCAISCLSFHHAPALVLFVCLFVCLFLVFRDRVSLCSPGCPGTHFVDQAGLELRNLPAFASRLLGLKACATTPGIVLFLMRKVALHGTGHDFCRKALAVQRLSDISVILPSPTNGSLF